MDPQPSADFTASARRPAAARAWAMSAAVVVAVGLPRGPPGAELQQALAPVCEQILPSTATVFAVTVG